MFANSNLCEALKNGSYWRTGFPLLLKIVQPLPTHRGLTSGPPRQGDRAQPEFSSGSCVPKPSE